MFKLKFCLCIICLCVFLYGCVEPYPAFRVKEVSLQEVPGHVKKTYMEKYSDDRILEIYQSTFESHFQGRPKCWQFKYETCGKKKESVIIDNKGEEVDFEKWFHPDYATYRYR